MLFRSEEPVLIENYRIINLDNTSVAIEIPVSKNIKTTDPNKGKDGAYRIELNIDDAGKFILQPGDTLSFGAHIGGYKMNQSPNRIDIALEKEKRLNLVSSWMDNLILETPDTIINTMFSFSKIRALESIYETAGGPMHGPGGESFYAAIWANDQAEYMNPYFPFINYEYGNSSAINSFNHFARFMNNEWKPIPSSIIAEGEDIWNGAGDRGDGAMIAYGAGRFALALGKLGRAHV